MCWLQRPYSIDVYKMVMNPDLGRICEDVATVQQFPEVFEKNYEIPQSNW
jgi:hypothetical protein